MPLIIYKRYPSITDEDGSLKPRDEILRRIVHWFMSWQPGLDEEKALERAENYMKAMPAWAD